MMTDAGREMREMSLREWIEDVRSKQPNHRAVKEYDRLRTRRAQRWASSLTNASGSDGFVRRERTTLAAWKTSYAKPG